MLSETTAQFMGITLHAENDPVSALPGLRPIPVRGAQKQKAPDDEGRVMSSSATMYSAMAAMSAYRGRRRATRKPKRSQIHPEASLPALFATPMSPMASWRR